MDKNPFNEQTEENKATEKEADNKDLNKEVDSNKKDDTIPSEKENQDTKDDVQNDFEQKYQELNNNYIRLAADFDNYRKRTAQEKDAIADFASGEVLKKLTVVLDTFERARESLKDIEDPKTVKDGYEVAFKQLTDTLNKMGMAEITALGEAFDPKLHEAVTQIPTNEYDPDTVAVVMQKGYKLNDKVLRPALVGVARAMEQDNSQENG